jgi:hypothetical protein
LPHLTDLAREMWTFLFENDMYLVAEHIPGKLNVTADFLSRIVDKDDWRLNRGSFEETQDRLGHCDVDRFASYKNTQLPVYNSRHFDPHTSGVNAFASDWKGSFSYCNPPFVIAGKVINHIIKYKARAVLVLPIWASKPWFSILQRITIDHFLLRNIPDLFGPAVDGPRMVGTPRWQVGAFLVDGSLI